MKLVFSFYFWNMLLSLLPFPLFCFCTYLPSTYQDFFKNNFFCKVEKSNNDFLKPIEMIDNTYTFAW
jgi:hypothetical protein